MEKEELDKMIKELANLFCQILNETDLHYKQNILYSTRWNNILDKYDYESEE